MRISDIQAAVTFVAMGQFQTSAALVLQPTKFEFVVKPLKSAKAVVVARLQRTSHPEHCLVADIDIVLARERQLAVIANTEHRQARGYWLYRIAIPHIHRQIVLRHQWAPTRVNVKGTPWIFWVSMCWIGMGSPMD